MQPLHRNRTEGTGGSRSVKAVTMSLEQKNATVELVSDVSDEVLTKAVVDAGYEVKGVTAKIRLPFVVG